MGVPNNKQHAQFARELWVGEDPEDRANLVHIADNTIDFENGALTIDADGLTSTTGDITAHVGRFSSDLLVSGLSFLTGGAIIGTSLEVGGLSNFFDTVFIGETASLPGGEMVSIDATTGAVATTGTVTATGTAGDAVLSGDTGYTSPYGAISIVQKTGVVQASTATAVLGATALTADAGGQDIVAGITNPDVPRNVTALGNAAGIVGDVVVTGTNWAGEVITDTIALNGANEVAGVKAFATVTAVHLPPETHAGTDTVSIGCGNCLGLQRPIAAAGAVVEVARKAAAAAEYTIEATGTVSAANGTVDQSGVGAIVHDDRFEITYNASTI